MFYSNPESECVSHVFRLDHQSFDVFGSEREGFGQEEEGGNCNFSFLISLILGEFRKFDLIFWNLGIFQANRSAKLKQCKLDARREQWLSQGTLTISYSLYLAIYVIRITHACI